MQKNILESTQPPPEKPPETSTKIRDLTTRACDWVPRVALALEVPGLKPDDRIAVLMELKNVLLKIPPLHHQIPMTPAETQQVLQAASDALKRFEDISGPILEKYGIVIK